MTIDGIMKWAEFARNQSNTDQMIADPYSICYQFGIDVIIKKMDNDGYLICSEGCKFIIINANIINKHRRRFIAAHEIGHYLMHNNSMYCCTNLDETYQNIVNTYDQEHEANEFASELLLPYRELSQKLPEHELHFKDVSVMANLFNVSMTMCARKMVQMSITGKEVLLYYNGDKLLWYITGNKIYPGINFKELFCKYNTLADKMPKIVTWRASSQTNDNNAAEVFNPFGGQKMVLISDYSTVL